MRDSANGLVALTTILALSVAWGVVLDARGDGALAGGSLPVTPRQTSPLADMYPGDSAQALSGNFENPNDGPAYVNTVTVSIASVTRATASPRGRCDASDYTIANVTMPVNSWIPAGTARGFWHGATIKFNDKRRDQSACMGASIRLVYDVS